MKKVVVSIIFILLVSLIGISLFLVKSNKFNISKITVLNSDNIDDVILRSNVQAGDNLFSSIFKINKNKIKENNTYIKDVKVNIKIPNEYIINIIKRKSVYYIFNKEKNLYYNVDIEGIILEEKNDINLKQNEVIVNNITFDDTVVLGSKINEIDYNKLVNYEKIKEKIYENIKEYNITKVDFKNSLTTIFLNDKLEVVFPNTTDLDYNIKVLKQIIKDIGNSAGIIDLTKQNPTFIAI